MFSLLFYVPFVLVLVFSRAYVVTSLQKRGFPVGGVLASLGFSPLSPSSLWRLVLFFPFFELAPLEFCWLVSPSGARPLVGGRPPFVGVAFSLVFCVALCRFCVLFG